MHHDLTIQNMSSNDPKMLQAAYDVCNDPTRSDAARLLTDATMAMRARDLLQGSLGIEYGNREPLHIVGGRIFVYLTSAVLSNALDRIHASSDPTNSSVYEQLWEHRLRAYQEWDDEMSQEPGGKTPAGEPCRRSVDLNSYSSVQKANPMLVLPPTLPEIRQSVFQQADDAERRSGTMGEGRTIVDPFLRSAKNNCACGNSRWGVESCGRETVGLEKDVISNSQSSCIVS